MPLITPARRPRRTAVGLAILITPPLLAAALTWATADTGQQHTEMSPSARYCFSHVLDTPRYQYVDPVDPVGTIRGRLMADGLVPADWTDQDYADCGGGVAAGLYVVTALGPP